MGWMLNGRLRRGLFLRSPAAARTGQVPSRGQGQTRVWPRGLRRGSLPGEPKMAEGLRYCARSPFLPGGGITWRKWFP